MSKRCAVVHGHAAYDEAAQCVVCSLRLCEGPEEERFVSESEPVQLTSERLLRDGEQGRLPRMRKLGERLPCHA